MARPDGRAFLRPLGAGSPRGGALRGSSALAPGLGLVAASVWARPFGRAVNGPGLGPALPTRRPRGLVLLTARQGMPALRAGGGSRPRPLGASLPPPAACGPLPLPTLGGLGAARPARLRRSGICGGWSPPAAAQVCAPAGLASRQPLLGGTPPRRKAKPPAGAAARALPRSSPSPVAASVLRRGPAPTLWGLWGRPRLRPGRAWLRPAAPRWPACGSACARPSRRSGPAPLRRPAAEPRGGVRALWARPVRGRNLDAARKGLARVAGRGPIPRRARLWRGVAPPAGGSATSPTIRQGQDKPPAAGLV